MDEVVIKKIFKPVIMQHYSSSQINDGGPATGAVMLINSYLKDKYDFILLDQTFAPHGLNIRLLLDFYKKIKKAKPDILHIRGLQSEGLYGVVAGKLAGCKRIVVSVHGIYSDCIGIKGFKKYLFLKIIEPLTLRLADLVYCVCEYATKRQIIVKNAKHLFGYIHNAAPDYSSLDREVCRNQIRSNYKIGDKDIVITTVSRITEDKGFATLMEAIKKSENRKNVIYLIVGDGKYLDVLKISLSSEIQKGTVLLLGKSAQVPEILLASDIFVFPSLHENLSNSLLEACAASLPCIVTNVGGNPEVIINNHSGIIIEPNNPAKLSDAIEKLVNSKKLRTLYGMQAQKRMEEYFSKRMIFEKISTAYDSLLNI